MGNWPLWGRRFVQVQPLLNPLLDESLPAPCVLWRYFYIHYHASQCELVEAQVQNHFRFSFSLCCLPHSLLCMEFTHPSNVQAQACFWDIFGSGTFWVIWPFGSARNQSVAHVRPCAGLYWMNLASVACSCVCVCTFVNACGRQNTW